MWQYIVLLGAVVFIAAFIMPRKKEKSEEAERSLEKMELALEQFMENMEADNRELAELAAEAHKQSAAQAERHERRIAELELRLKRIELGMTAQAPEKAEGEAGAAFARPDRNREPMTASEAGLSAEAKAETPADSTPIRSIQDRHAELLELYRQGKSIEAIAKKLRRSKGEVQLILQLAKQEEAVHA